MKKLVTLSAVALAGATVGVGSTFGWWPAEDLKPQPPQVAQDAPAELNIEFVQPVEAAKDSGDSQIDIIGDLQPPRPKIAVIQKLDPASGNLAKLAKELEQEASELDKKGQKEAAEEKRAVARRIREALPKVTIGIGHGPGPKGFPRDGEKGKPGHESPASAVEREIHRLHEALNKTDDPALQEKLKTAIQSLKMKLQHIQATGPQFKVQHFEFRDPSQGPAGHPGMPHSPRMMASGQGPGGGPPFVIEELRKVADNLQREGHPEQARAIREHIERMQDRMREMQARMKEHAQHGRRDAERGPGDGPHPGDDRDRPHREFRHEEPRPHGAEPRDGERRGPHPGDFHRPEGHHPHPGPHPGEVMGMLKALHHEIAELRGEVHQLRKMLGHDHHPQPRDAKHRDRDGDDDRDEPRSKKRGDDDDDDDKDEAKSKRRDKDQDDDDQDADEEKSRDEEDVDVQLDDAPAKNADDAKGVEDQSDEAKEEQKTERADLKKPAETSEDKPQLDD